MASQALEGLSRVMFLALVNVNTEPVTIAVGWLFSVIVYLVGINQQMYGIHITEERNAPCER